MKRRGFVRYVATIAVLVLSWVPSANATSFAKVFKKVDSAVVTIFAAGTTKLTTPGGAAVNKQDKGLGTGVLIAKEGKILTAAHVVHVSDEVVVKINGHDKLFSARIVSSSLPADVSLLQLNNPPDNLRIASLGDSEKIEVGEEVFVIGNPYGIEHTLTVGHLSALHRHQIRFNLDGYDDIEFFQTDAAINKGNSGGPVFNTKGKVIGIVSHIKSTTGGSQGLGFATAINSAKKLLLERDAVWSGVEWLPVEGVIAQALNVDVEWGMLVQRVAKNSIGYYLDLEEGSIPAKIYDKDVLLGGDIIVEIMGTPLRAKPNNLRDVFQKIAELPRGARIDVVVLRAGKKVPLFTSKPKY